MGKCPIIVLSVLISLFLASNIAAKQRGISVTAKTPAGKTIPLYGNSYALVIGNGNYAKGWDPLPGAVQDVKDVAKALEKSGFDKVILKTNLTRNGFNRAFGNFFYKYGRDKNNRLLFYYAGHGYTQKMANDEDLGYLVMVDAPVPEKDPVGFEISSVDMQSIVTRAKKTKAKHVLFMFDSCFSGSILNLRERVAPKNISENVRLPVRQFITAGRSNEPVPDHSIFKQAFLDLLEGQDKEPIPDGYITGEELGLYLKNKVPEYNPTQHPQYGKIKDIHLDKGDFVFIMNKSLISGKLAPTSPTRSESQRLKEKRARLERKRRELEEMKALMAEQKRLDAERKRLEAEKNKYKTAKLTTNPAQPPPVSGESEAKEIGSDGRFIAYANGTVLDTETGLEWIAGPEEWWLTFEDAKSWVEKLAVDGGSWQMPTLSQVESLYVQGSGSHNVTSFLRISQSYVWCTKNDAPSTPKRFYFGLSSYWSPRNYSSNIQALAVRVKGKNATEIPYKRPESSLPKPAKEIIRDGRFIAYDNGIVLDTETNLMWAAKDGGKGLMEYEVNDFIKSFKRGGFMDWRLPTMEELEMLYDPRVENKLGYHIIPLIAVSGEWVWGYEGLGNMWAFDFSRGIPAHKDKRDSGYWSYTAASKIAHVLPVREPNN